MSKLETPEGDHINGQYRAAVELVRALRRDGLLEAGLGFSDDAAAEAVISALNGKSPSEWITVTVETLLEVPGVEELFADDAEMERRLRQAFAA